MSDQREGGRGRDGWMDGWMDEWMADSLRALKGEYKRIT